MPNPNLEIVGERFKKRGRWHVPCLCKSCGQQFETSEYHILKGIISKCRSCAKKKFGKFNFRNYKHVV